MYAQSSYVKTLNKIKLRESGVSKVVPSRIFSVAVHPNVERVLAACGDKWGRLGLWHVVCMKSYSVYVWVGLRTIKITL